MKRVLSKSLTLVLLSYLVLQLFVLNPSLISFPNVSVGTIETFAQAEQVLMPKTVYEVALARKDANEKDVLVFTGDIMLARNVEWLIEQQSATFPFDKIVLRDLGKNPAIIGNFEASIPFVHQVAPPLSMRFAVKPEFLPLLKDVGYTHLSLANNHSSDFGAEGYSNALTLLRQEQIVPFGNGRSVGACSAAYVETKAGTIALIGINASDRVPDFTAVKQVMQAARARSEYQIVYIHWGTEYEQTHSKVQEVIATALVREGADMIVGHHPHVVQDIDIIDGVVVLYSLGNFIFDQYFSTEVQQGLVVRLDVSEGPTLSLLPVTSEAHKSQPAFMDQAVAESFLEALSRRSDESLRADIKNGRLPIQSMVASSPKDAIILR